LQAAARQLMMLEDMCWSVLKLGRNPFHLFSLLHNLQCKCYKVLSFRNTEIAFHWAIENIFCIKRCQMAVYHIKSLVNKRCLYVLCSNGWIWLIITIPSDRSISNWFVPTIIEYVCPTYFDTTSINRRYCCVLDGCNLEILDVCFHVFLC